MDRTVPTGAALLLDFIGGIEAPKGYGTIYGNNQGKLPKPLTAMTLGDIIDEQKNWTRRFKSSASGRYQFMRATLIDLSKELHLSGAQVFNADFQDRLGYHLLKRRGYEAFMAGISRTEFGKRLAQEWASLPVLAPTQGGSRKVSRGQSFYAGDGLNKSLVKPETVEALLDRAKAAQVTAPKPSIPGFRADFTASGHHPGRARQGLGLLAAARRQGDCRALLKERTLTMWSSIKRFFKDSETIFLARLQVLVGIVLTVLATFDPSTLAPLIGDKWFGPFLFVWGIISEAARRHRADDLK